ncbi:MAG: hypothetical protein M3Y76_09805 [Chloroflexota bacterium]|nr:hypothetical protein [Chloroflexota bacterium]
MALGQSLQAAAHRLADLCLLTCCALTLPSLYYWTASYMVGATGLESGTDLHQHRFTVFARLLAACGQPTVLPLLPLLSKIRDDSSLCRSC